ncbi:MAG: hypothetical protein ABJC63_16975 [Gemmatimonadales bacterium]
MTKAKTNALEALRALIAERQQYEQWISTLESKRQNTPAHVFDRVQGDYNTRLNRVLTDINGHAEELQLSISALSSRLVEVARDEDTRRDALQEAELRATVGEYEPHQWEQLRGEAERGLETVAADRASLDGQLTELRSIQKLSEVGSKGSVSDVVTAPIGEAEDAVALVTAQAVDNQTLNVPNVDSSPSLQASAPRDQGHLPLDQPKTETERESAPQPSTTSPDGSELPGMAQAATPQPVTSAPVAPAVASAANGPPAPTPPQRTRTGRTPPFGSQVAKAKAPESRVDQSKTLKCPECGTANYATEWYCERCGGELATM